MTRRSLSDLSRDLEDLDHAETGDYPVLSLAVLLSDKDVVAIDRERRLYRVDGEIRQAPRALDPGPGAGERRDA